MSLRESKVKQSPGRARLHVFSRCNRECPLTADDGERLLPGQESHERVPIRAGALQHAGLCTLHIGIGRGAVYLTGAPAPAGGCHGNDALRPRAIRVKETKTREREGKEEGEGGEVVMCIPAKPWPWNEHLCLYLKNAQWGLRRKRGGAEVHRWIMREWGAPAVGIKRWWRRAEGVLMHCKQFPLTWSHPLTAASSQTTTLKQNE